MGIQVSHAVLNLTKEFPAIGTGKCPVLFWDVGEFVFAYWHKALTVFRIHKDQWALIDKVISDIDYKSRSRAIVVNRSKATTNKEWNGGQLVELMLKAIAGEEVNTLEFKQYLEADTLAYPPGTPGPFEKGQRVTLSYDADFKGTIYQGGPEVSAITPDGEKGKEVFIPNGKIVRLPDEQPAVKAKAKKPVATAVEQAEKEDEDMAKKAKGKKTAKKAPAKKAAGAKKSTKSRLTGRAVMTIAENPRKKGTRGFEVHSKFASTVKSHPDWSIAQVMDASGADARDVAYMVEKKHIKIVGAS